MKLKDLRSGLKATDSQKINEDDVVVRRGPGRPSRTGMKQYGVRMHESFHEEIVRFCKNAGVGKSAFIVSAVKLMMSDEASRNKLLVDNFL